MPLSNGAAIWRQVDVFAMLRSQEANPSTLSHGQSAHITGRWAQRDGVAEGHLGGRHCRPVWIPPTSIGSEFQT